MYGIFPVPDTTKSAEGIAHILRHELEDSLGPNGVTDTPMPKRIEVGYAFVDRVVVEINAQVSDRSQLEFVHHAVAMAATVARPYMQ